MFTKEKKEVTLPSILHDGESYYLWTDGEFLYISAYSTIAAGESTRVAHPLLAIYNKEDNFEPKGTEMAKKIYDVLEKKGYFKQFQEKEKPLPVPENKNQPEWLFKGTWPTGYSYSDKRKQRSGDYHQIGMVKFAPLEIDIYDKSPKYNDVHEIMKSDYEDLLTKDEVQISTSGQMTKIVKPQLVGIIGPPPGPIGMPGYTGPTRHGEIIQEENALESEKEGVTQSPHEIESLITNIYDNAFTLNRAIEQTIDLIVAGKGEITAEVKNFISQYSGMGGLEKFGATGKGLLYEYFTPDEIIKRMWGLAFKHGYQNGSVLEPSVGVGRFIKYLPEKVSRCLGLEINKYSHFISQALYGDKAEIRLQYFEQLFMEHNKSIKGKIENVEKFDLVIGNPPYGDYTGRYAAMGERRYTRAKNYVQYFISRGLDCLNPGGLLIYIVGAEAASGGEVFLDSPTNQVKKLIEQKGELIDAYRLPSAIFERTGVNSDIVVFRKK